MLSSNSLRRNDSRILRLLLLWLLECILVCANKLSLVVWASITDNNLWRVLIWHHNSWLWESASESVRVIWFKRLFDHASMEVLSDFILVLRKSSYFSQALFLGVNGLGSAIRECKTNCLSIFLKDFTARGNLSVLEHSSGIDYLFIMNVSFVMLSGLFFHSLLLFLGL